MNNEGKNICPYCGEEIENDIEKCPHCNEMFVKTCPYCGEKIKANAIKCKYCHERLDNYECDKEERSTLKRDIFIVVLIIIIMSMPGILFLCLNPSYLTDQIKLYEALDNSKNKITKSDYIGEWDEVTAGRIYINIEDMGNYIKFTEEGSNSANSSSKSIYTCHYNNQTGDLICKGAKHIDTFASCNGFSVQDNFEEYYACEEETPELIEEASKTYSDNEERIFSIKKGDKSRSIIDEMDFFSEEQRQDVRENYQNMGLYLKVENEVDGYYFLKAND